MTIPERAARTNTGFRLRPILLVLVFSMFGVGSVAAQSLEEETRSAPGTNSLTDDSDRLRGNDGGSAPTDSLDNDSMDLRGRSPDQDGTNSLDDGSLQGGDSADPD